ncbi:PTS IIA-like nitrogen regulatory protein PtsN [Algiphilus aromaticivorans]|uniref:PTS IIA-like nitrogen regulatory protein PtsN n=1 Tax=Algiphilus aromaticivorans TaxID=382454 RepID=UPI0005C245EA|nr:PTS IIA-like nitrogen regulatory protein PtsN [Algiphilus aromaticivorans]
MKLAEVLDASRVSIDQSLSSKKRALEEISKLLSGRDGLAEADIFNALMAREKLGSTGLGHGVAIPHGRMSETRSTTAALIRLTHGVDYDAHDGQAVDLVFGLIVPQSATEDHLKLLAAVAEKFSEEDFCKQLRAAESPEAAVELLTA